MDHHVVENLTGQRHGCLGGSLRWRPSWPSGRLHQIAQALLDGRLDLVGAGATDTGGSDDFCGRWFRRRSTRLLVNLALDAVPSQFCAGELEATIVEAFEFEDPDVIIVEGQGSLSHPAFSSSSFILRGSCPNGVVLQHAPRRSKRCDFENMAMPTPASEINLIETFSDTKIIGLTINHEQMSDLEVSAAIIRYEQELGIPVTDALTRSPERLVDMVLAAFPDLKGGLAAIA